MERELQGNLYEKLARLLEYPGENTIAQVDELARGLQIDLPVVASLLTGFRDDIQEVTPAELE